MGTFRGFDSRRLHRLLERSAPRRVGDLALLPVESGRNPAPNREERRLPSGDPACDRHGDPITTCEESP
jgi:hypothetical protein